MAVPDPGRDRLRGSVGTGGVLGGRARVRGATAAGGFASWPAFHTSIGIPEPDWNMASAVIDQAGAGPRIYFQRVPEPKRVKKRVHVDVNAGAVGDQSEAERRARVTTKVEQLMEAGATVFKEFEERGEHWAVMQDPEGNEFCV